MIALERMSDLAGTYFLTANCDTCNRCTRFYPAELMKSIGDILISEFRERTTCSGCNQRTKDIRIVFDSPIGPPDKTHPDG